MGLIDKFKNMFTEEVDEEDIVVEKKEPAKSENKKKPEVAKRYTEKEVETEKEEIKVTPITTEVEKEEVEEKKVSLEEPVIKHQEKTNTVTEEPKPFLKREEKFVFPVYFDDKDFEKIDESDRKRSRTVEEKKQPVEPVKKEIYGSKIEKKEEPKVFKPTPIISPIYGILDKNYHKDDITAKKVPHTEYRDSSKPLTIDDVRKKAYGNLEDDIETTLLAKSSIFMEPDNTPEEDVATNNLLSDLVDNNDMEESEYNSVDEFLNSPTTEYEAKHKPEIEDDEFDLDKIEIPTSKKKKKSSVKDKTSLDDLLGSDDYSNDDLLEEYMNKTDENEENNYDDDEDLTQNDLFNLIDSMYEKGEDE